MCTQNNDLRDARPLPGGEQPQEAWLTDDPDSLTYSVRDPHAATPPYQPVHSGNLELFPRREFSTTPKGVTRLTNLRSRTLCLTLILGITMIEGIDS